MLAVFFVLYVSIQQTPYFPLWKFFLVLREFKTWNNEELSEGEIRGLLNAYTTVQTIELTPDFMLDNTQSFFYGYRNVSN